MYFLSRLRTAAAVLKHQPVKQTVRYGGDWAYRRLTPEPPKHIFYIAEGIGFIMWYWILYHIYYEPEHLFGHFPYPDPSEWTDEELGIPPDDYEGTGRLEE